MVLQKLTCPRCGKICGKKESPDNRKRRPIIKSRKPCHSCKKLARRNMSKRMKKNNPMYHKDTVDKMSKTLKKRYEKGEIVSSFANPEIKKQAELSVRAFWKSEKSTKIRKRFSKRLQKNNPMHNKKSLSKMLDTCKILKEKGILTTPKGKDHWNWKGNRPFSFFVRSRLYKTWNLLILKRDRFKCSICGEKKRRLLQVHHLRPFSQILQLILSTHSIQTTDNLLQSDPDFASQLADEIVSEHNLSDGITVCRKCHSKIDPNYKSANSDSF